MPVQLSNIRLDRDSNIPLARQLYMHMHQQILHGYIGYKEQLPTTRALAQELELSRGVVVSCYDMLKVDGLISGFGKGGTQVSYPIQAQSIDAASSKNQCAAEPLSRRGQKISDAREYPALDESASPMLLTPSVPDFSLFPYSKWQQVSRDALHDAPVWYQRDGGILQLKKSLQHYLSQYRGIHVDNLDCLLITTGTQAALSLLARLLAEPGEQALVDQVGWPGAQAAMEQAGLQTVLAPVDEQGTQLSGWKSQTALSKPKILVITPSCQFPTGRAMSMQRRESFIRYTAENRAWLIEDDYAAEYSYSQHPAPSILAHVTKQSAAHHLIHVGTMSKLLLPSLRLGWMVVPEHIASATKNALNTLGLQPPYMVQQQLSYFMQYGYLSTHLSNTRAIYNERGQRCSAYLERHAKGYFRVMPSISGMNHYLKMVDSTVDVAKLTQFLRENGLGCDIFQQSNGSMSGKYLLLGHANLQEDVFEETLDRFIIAYQSFLGQ